MRVNNKTKIKKIITIMLCLTLFFSFIYSYWFFTRDIEVNFLFFWEYPLEKNQERIPVQVYIDGVTSLYFLVVKQDENNDTPYKEFKTFIRYGEHKFDIYYYNKSITISKNIFISDNIYIITHQKSPTELYVEIMYNEPN